MVQRIGDHRVLLVEDGLEQTAVGVEARRVEDRVVGAEERRQPRLQLLVHGLRAADETHRGHAVAVVVESLVSRGDDVGMVGEPEVVVGAQVETDEPSAKLDVRRLRANRSPARS